MKKLTLIIAALAISLHGMAQEKYVTSALTALKSQNYDEAKESIDRAMASPETKDKPKTLFAKAQVYFVLQQSGGEKYKAGNPYREGAQALFKLLEVKNDYEKETVDQYLMFAAFYYYNDGVKAFNDKKYSESADLLKNVVKIYDLKNAKHFDKVQLVKNADTIVATAYQILGTSAYYLGKYDEAIPMLVKVKNNPITKTPTAYELLIDAYDKQNAPEKVATIEEARKAFPDDLTLRNYELNYYIKSGKQEDLIKKLEEAAVKEPNNSDILFNLATTYLGMANPKDGKKSPNEAEYIAKAEDAFQRALKLSPENTIYNYNFGALYYNQATEYNNQMNAITGTTAADQKKFESLQSKRDGLFTKSMPYFEKAYNILSANETTLKGEDMVTYKAVLQALREIYARQNKQDKMAEMKKKYDALH